jgi:hypothetical protein
MIRALVWLAVLGVGIYIASRYAAPQIRAWRFEDAMSQTVRLSEAAGESEMRRALLEIAGDLHVPLSSRRLQVHRDRDGRTLISASWEEIVRLEAWKLGEWVDTLHYSYEAQGEPEARLP